MSSSSRDPDEETASSSEALDEVNRHIKKVFEILESEKVKLSKEMEAFDAVAKKLKSVHFSKMLKLNVGGKVFDTSLETMKSDPGSMLYAMFSGRFDSKPAEDGCYFIDRDGTHFRLILNYLRSGQLVLPEDKILRRELLTEAEFYQIKGIIDEMKVSPFENSSILSVEHRQILASWLKGTLTSACHTYSLIYRASRDGWAASNFHSCCDRKGPTVTVIKCGNYIFGGYTEQYWEALSSGTYKKAPASFLFSLVNPNGLQPSMMSLIQGKEGSAIHCYSSYGPTFGDGPDLRIVNAPNSNSCSASLNNTYQLPTGQNAGTFLTGNSSFTLSEMEVFRFENIYA